MHVFCGCIFTGANGYRVDKIISVHELIKELTEG
ncbi:nitronate monooxygenase [Helicobacter pylori]|nr:nitronate monooxygenase [Helicobacter pylori]